MRSHLNLAYHSAESVMHRNQTFNHLAKIVANQIRTLGLTLSLLECINQPAN